MSGNVIFFGWNRSIPGRETLSAAHFQEFIQYATGLQQGGAIESFEPVLLTIHGGELNGFFMIRGESARLDAVVSSEEWLRHVARAGLHLEGAGVVRGVTGELLMKQMGLWTELIPK